MAEPTSDLTEKARELARRCLDDAASQELAAILDDLADRLDVSESGLREIGRLAGNVEARRISYACLAELKKI